MIKFATLLCSWLNQTAVHFQIGLRILVIIGPHDVLGLDARISKDYNNRGLMWVLDKGAMDLLKLQYPNLSNIAWVVINSGRYQKWIADNSRKPEWSLLLRMVS